MFSSDLMTLWFRSRIKKILEITFIEFLRETYVKGCGQTNTDEGILGRQKRNKKQENSNNEQNQRCRNQSALQN